MTTEQAALSAHVARLLACERCPRMHRPAVSGGPVLSPVLLVGQAPGIREPVARRPFAWTAGKTMFRWFHEAAGVDEERFRATIYMAAVARCFPGRNPNGGDRVPDAEEIATCSDWLAAEIGLLRPRLVIPVGKLAIAQFLPVAPLTDLIGKSHRGHYRGAELEIIPLPHPSGASPWHRIEPGKTLLGHALRLIAAHPAWCEAVR